MRKFSKKREIQNRMYKKLCDQIDEELKDKRQWKCFFCMNPLPENTDHHHLAGRDGDMLLAKEYLKPVHRECHRKYHDYPVQRLMAEKWYQGFLERLKSIDMELLNKELNKQLKS